MSSQPAYRIYDFFASLGRIKNTAQFNAWCATYWYVIFTMCLVTVGMCILNIALIIFFCQRCRSKDRLLKRAPRKPEMSRRVLIPQKLDEEYEATRRFQDSNIQFKIDALEANNRYRVMHRAPPLRLNEDLTLKAQEWADTMARNRKLMASPPTWRTQGGKPVGESVASMHHVEITGNNLMKLWYDEMPYHNYSVNQLQPKTKNFSQMVWNESQEVGYGRARDTNDWWYAVAIYSPPGNINGKFFDNVYPAEI